MKFTSTLIALSATLFPLTANAYCSFRLKVANSQNHDLDGTYVQSFNNVATLGPPFTNVTLSFSPGSTGPSTINSIGFSNEGTGRLALAPSLGVERLIFVDGDTLPEGARYMEWAIPNPGVNSALTYGTVAPRFVIYSPPSSVAHYEIYWVPAGTPFVGVFHSDLVAECVNGIICDV
ncbi:hypothetical protein Q9L58_010109 [Maublancomyces gigas]|uniref:Uncharacterized protein n=1 Tax=Discina gigas TaxID=1032678 RepID=A0ABR3G5F2_9PEZI